MRKISLLISAVTVCGCTSSIPVRTTGTPNESDSRAVNQNVSRNIEGIRV